MAAILSRGGCVGGVGVVVVGGGGGGGGGWWWVVVVVVGGVWFNAIVEMFYKLTACVAISVLT